MERMTNDFCIAVHGWLSSDYGPTEERETIAELFLSLGDVCLTEVEELRTASVRKTVRVSAYHLAKWLLNSWWRHRWEPELTRQLDEDVDWYLTHDIAAIGNGFAWPPYSITADGDYYSLRSLPPVLKSLVSPIRYLNRITRTLVSASTFELSVDDFVATVIARLDNRGIRDSDLHELRRLVSAERRDPQLADLRRREGLLGFDPDEAPASLFDFLNKQSKAVGRDAADEIAAATLAESRSADLSNVFTGVSKSVEQASTLGDELQTDVKWLREAFAKTLTTAAPPYLQGVRAARLFRDTLNMGDEPAPNSLLESRLGAPHALLEGNASDSSTSPLSVGARLGDGRLAVALAPRSKHARRFEFARIIADDFFYAADDAWRPVTPTRTGRQQFQRAFAAEFLCPIHGLLERLSHANLGEARIDDLAQEYDVSTWVVDRQIQNNNNVEI
jgi:hypothetical protein